MLFNDLFAHGKALGVLIIFVGRKAMLIIMLEVQHLSYVADERGVKRKIVDDVSFSIGDGELIVVTGPNGGGKSTIAKILMGIEKPSGGKIFLDGQDITDMEIDERAKTGVGFAFQQPPRFKGMKIKRLLSLAAGGELSDDQCCKLLSSVGLCAREYLNRDADATLSGGEIKRIEIASVLAKQHKLCIFDEPEAGIDLWSFSMLIKRFEQMHSEKSGALLIISHQQRIIDMADRLLIIRDGKVDAVGNRENMQDLLCTCGSDPCMCRSVKGGDIL